MIINSNVNGIATTGYPVFVELRAVRDFSTKERRFFFRNNVLHFHHMWIFKTAGVASYYDYLHLRRRSHLIIR